MMDLPVYDAVEIQVAIDVAAVTTGVARIPPGIYVATAPVRLTSNVKLIFDPAAILRRKFATNEATLWQAEPGTKIVNVSVSGGRIDNADANGSTYPGPQISLYGDNVAISEMQVLNFHSLPGTGGFGGNGINITGNDNRLTNLYVVTTCTTTGAGGIRMLGGNNFLCSNCFVSSGDDALQFVPDPTTDLSISNSQYVNCVAVSAAARACAVFLENRDVGTMSASITDCAFIAIRGRGGSVGAICASKAASGPTSGAISNIQFIGVSLALPSSATGPNFVVQRDASNSLNGPIEDIAYIGCTAIGPVIAGAALYVQEAARVRWIGGSLTAGMEAATACRSCRARIARSEAARSSAAAFRGALGHRHRTRRRIERNAVGESFSFANPTTDSFSIVSSNSSSNALVSWLAFNTTI